MHTSVISISSREVICDIRAAAWLDSETHPECNLHQRHELADICEKDNIDRVWRVLGMCDSEIRVALRHLLTPDRPLHLDNDLYAPDTWTYAFKASLPPHTTAFLKEKIHEYMVARAMADRLAVLIPEAAPAWNSNARDAMSEITGAASTACSLRPARRPLWPL